MKMKTIMLALMLVSISAFAQVDHNGNGGSGVVCADNGRTTIEMRDYFNAVDAEGWILNLAGANEDEKVKEYIRRLTTLDPGMGQELSRLYALWPMEMNTMVRSEIPEINDTRFPVKSKRSVGCYRIQIAVQRSEVRPREKRYLIDNDFWLAMNATQRAGLIIHELLYRLEIPKYEKNQANSDGVAYMNGLISSNQYGSLTQDEYFLAFQSSLKNDFSTHVMAGFNFQTSSIRIREDEIYGNTSEVYPLTYIINGETFAFGVTKNIALYRGQLVEGYLAQEATLKIHDVAVTLNPKLGGWMKKARKSDRLNVQLSDADTLMIKRKLARTKKELKSLDRVGDSNTYHFWSVDHNGVLGAWDMDF